MTRQLCTSVEETDETGKDPAGNNDGCTDENGKRRKIGEKWPFDDGCNFGGLVSN